MRRQLFVYLFLFFAVAVVSLELITQSVSAAYIPTEGDLIKISYDPAIYYVNNAGQRKLFVNGPTFWSWYSGTWNDQDIKIISQDDFDKLYVGENMAIRPGTNLIKFQNSNNIYAVRPGNKLCKTTTNYGDNWRDRLVTIQNSFESNYIMDTICRVDADTKLPNATIIQYNGSSQKFYIENGIKRLLTDNGFNLNKFQDKFVVKNVSQSMTFNNDISRPLDSKEFWINDDILDLEIGDFFYQLSDSSNTKANFIVDIMQENDLSQNIGIDLYIDGSLVSSIDRLAHKSEQYLITWDNPIIGDHICKIVIDSKDQVDESNENNNTKQYSCIVAKGQ